MRKIFMLCSLSLLFTTSHSQIEIIAHRGASYLAPENTVASSKLAWELGADAVETDIYLSKDNRIMCIHDSNTKRTTGQNYKVKETDSDILRKLDAGSFKDKKYRGEKIPYLEEIIRAVPDGKKLVVELKCGSEVLPYLKSIVEKHGNDKNFVFIAFDLQTITDTKRIFPNNSCYWLCSNSLLLEKDLSSIPEADLDGVSLSYRIVNKKIAADIRNLNLELYTWTVDDPREAKHLISLGVKGITTNRPGWLKEQLF